MLSFGVFGFSLTVAFGICCSQTAHTAPTAPVWGFTGVVFLPQLSKPHTGAHGAEFRLQRFFREGFGSGRAENSRSSV